MCICIVSGCTIIQRCSSTDLRDKIPNVRTFIYSVVTSGCYQLRTWQTVVDAATFNRYKIWSDHFEPIFDLNHHTTSKIVGDNTSPFGHHNNQT